MGESSVSLSLVSMSLYHITVTRLTSCLPYDDYLPATLLQIDQILTLLESSEASPFQETGAPDAEDLDVLFADLFQPESVCTGEPPASTEGTYVVGSARPQMESSRELNQCSCNQPLDSLISSFDSFASPDSQIHPLDRFREQDDTAFICKLLSVQETL